MGTPASGSLDWNNCKISAFWLLSILLIFQVGLFLLSPMISPAPGRKHCLRGWPGALEAKGLKVMRSLVTEPDPGPGCLILRPCSPGTPPHPTSTWAGPTHLLPPWVHGGHRISSPICTSEKIKPVALGGAGGHRREEICKRPQAHVVWITELHK